MTAPCSSYYIITNKSFAKNPNQTAHRRPDPPEFRCVKKPKSAYTFTLTRCGSCDCTDCLPVTQDGDESKNANSLGQISFSGLPPSIEQIHAQMSRRFPAALYHKLYCLQKMAKIYVILANGKLKIRGVTSKT